MATGAAAAAAAMAQAIKASGAIVKVSPMDFQTLLSRANEPLIIYSEGGFLKKNFQYLFGHKGFVFFTKSPTQLNLPSTSETVHAESIWIPG